MCWPIKWSNKVEPWWSLDLRRRWSISNCLQLRSGSQDSLSNSKTLFNSDCSRGIQEFSSLTPSRLLPRFTQSMGLRSQIWRLKEELSSGCLASRSVPLTAHSIPSWHANTQDSVRTLGGYCSVHTDRLSASGFQHWLPKDRRKALHLDTLSGAF